MDLYSGLPYWIAKNPLYDYFNPLGTDHASDVVIIGGGITGALVANELCNAGVRCCLIDKRGIGNGSSTASTALLQYEIDTPLCDLIDIVGEEKAVIAYRSCLQSITDLEKVFEKAGYNPSFKRVSSVFYAGNRKGHSLIKKENETRLRHNFPVHYLSKKKLLKKYGIHAYGALENNESAQMDPYAGATHLIGYQLGKKRLEVFTHTEITGFEENADRIILTTGNGNKISCKYAVVAAGFEAGKFLPKEVMKLTSTYAIISQPLHEKYIWHKHSLIWETGDPYLYIRTDNENRIIVGGEDVEFKNPVKRDMLLRKKVSVLEKKIKKLFPDIPFVTDMAWCGTFSSTKDGLPFIGSWPGRKRMLYALGYGGNGITFSMIAAQMLKNKILKVKDDREATFGFERMV